jgi:hypothetical protein
MQQWSIDLCKRTVTRWKTVRRHRRLEKRVEMRRVKRVYECTHTAHVRMLRSCFARVFNRTVRALLSSTLDHWQLAVRVSMWSPNSKDRLSSSLLSCHSPSPSSNLSSQCTVKANCKEDGGRGDFHFDSAPDLRPAVICKLDFLASDDVTTSTSLSILSTPRSTHSISNFIEHATRQRRMALATGKILRRPRMLVCNIKEQCLESL